MLPFYIFPVCLYNHHLHCPTRACALYHAAPVGLSQASSSHPLARRLPSAGTRNHTTNILQCWAVPVLHPDVQPPSFFQRQGITRRSGGLGQHITNQLGLVLVSIRKRLDAVRDLGRHLLDGHRHLRWHLRQQGKATPTLSLYWHVCLPRTAVRGTFALLLPPCTLAAAQSEPTGSGWFATQGAAPPK